MPRASCPSRGRASSHRGHGRADPEPTTVNAFPRSYRRVVQDALCSVPTFPLPDRIGHRGARALLERIGGHQVRRRRRRRGPRGRGGNTRVGAHLGTRVPRPHPIRVARRRHQPRVRQRRGRRRRHLHEPRAAGPLTALHLVRRDPEVVRRRRPRQIHPTRPRRRSDQILSAPTADCPPLSASPPMPHPNTHQDSPAASRARTR